MSELRQSQDDDEVKQAIRGLLNQANTFSQTYLTDLTLQHQFREEYRFLGKCLLDDYHNGVYVRDKIVSLVRRERQSLIDQALEIGKNGIGLIAGTGQLTLGYGLCVTSSVFSIAGASWCSSVGVTMMAHGGNNIYESTYNITGNIVQNWKGQYTGNYGDGTGLLRKGYRRVAQSLGFDDREGDVAYAAVDLATSAYGLKNVLKPVPNANVPNAKQFQLFYYSSHDYIKGWKTMSGLALFNEASANSLTVYGAVKPYLVDEE